MDPNDRRSGRGDNEFDIAGVLGTTVRLFATLVGLIVIIVAAYLAVGLATSLISAATDPSAARDAINAWDNVVGKGALRVKSEAFEFDGSRVVALVLMGGVIVIAAWILLSLVRSGAEVVHITTSDRKAIQRVLRAALGRNAKVD